MSFLAKTRNPGVTKCVIPGEDQESRSHQVCHSWRRPGIQESPSVSFLAKTRNPAGSYEDASSNPFCWESSCHSWRRPGIQAVVIPGEDQESRSHQVCHSWRRPGIQESPSVSFLAKTRNPGVTKCVIPGEDQESRSHQVCHSWRRPGIQAVVIPGEDQESRSHQVCHSRRRPGIQESPSVSFLAKTRNPGVTKCVIPGEDQESSRIELPLAKCGGEVRGIDANIFLYASIPKKVFDLVKIQC